MPLEYNIKSKKNMDIISQVNWHFFIFFNFLLPVPTVERISAPYRSEERLNSQSPLPAPIQIRVQCSPCAHVEARLFALRFCVSRFLQATCALLCPLRVVRNFNAVASGAVPCMTEFAKAGLGNKVAVRHLFQNLDAAIVHHIQALRFRVDTTPMIRSFYLMMFRR